MGAFYPILGAMELSAELLYTTDQTSPRWDLCIDYTAGTPTPGSAADSPPRVDAAQCDQARAHGVRTSVVTRHTRSDTPHVLRLLDASCQTRALPLRLRLGWASQMGFQHNDIMLNLLEFIEFLLLVLAQQPRRI